MRKESAGRTAAPKLSHEVMVLAWGEPAVLAPPAPVAQVQAVTGAVLLPQCCREVCARIPLRVPRGETVALSARNVRRVRAPHRD